MSYTKEMFSLELETLLAEGQPDCSRIAEWAYATKLKHVREIDPDVDRWMEELGAMGMAKSLSLA